METPTVENSLPNQYVINNVQQLFELNHNLVNFKSIFSVKSLSGEPFWGIVVSQQILDSGDLPDFKSADQGVFSGEITQDNNLYTNWYLALKSQKPNKVVIDIQTFPVSPRDTNPPQQQSQSQHLQHHQHLQHSHPPVKESYFDSSSIMTVIAVASLLAAGYLAYRYYSERKVASKPVVNEIAASLMPGGSPPIFANPVISAPAVAAPMVSAPMVSAPMVSAPMVSAPVIPESIVPPIMSTENLVPELSTLNLGGSSTSDILGSDLMRQINNLPTI